MWSRATDLNPRENKHTPESVWKIGAVTPSRSRRADAGVKPTSIDVMVAPEEGGGCGFKVDADEDTPADMVRQDYGNAVKFVNPIWGRFLLLFNGYRMYRGEISPF